jgi:hypothetical protein
MRAQLAGRGVGKPPGGYAREREPLQERESVQERHSVEDSQPDQERIAEPVWLLQPQPDEELDEPDDQQPEPVQVA